MIAPNSILSETPPEKPKTKGQQTVFQRMPWGSPFYNSYGDGGCGPGGFGLANWGELQVAGIASIWPGWTSLLWGTYWTYRTMMRHATIGYVMDQIIAIVNASQWLVDADPDCDPDIVNWIKSNIVAKRDVLCPHSLTAVIFGNAAFEIVWSKDNGLSIDDFVPLLQDHTRILRDGSPQGRWLGIRNGNVDLLPSECLWIVNSSEPLGAEPGNDYGRSRLENIRDTAWVGWLDTARRLAELEDRVSGVVPVWEVPTTEKDESGMSMGDYARAALGEVTHPRSIGVVIENPTLGEANADDAPGKYKQMQSKIEPLNMGERAESQKAMQDKLKYWDDMMGRGLYRGERTLFATKGASRADSEQHSINSEPDAECVDSMVVRAVNHGPVRTGLLLKFGKNAMDKCRGIKPMPLVDKERVAASGLINTLAQNTQTGPYIFNMFDMTAVANIAGFPVRAISGVAPRPQPAALDPSVVPAQPVIPPPTAPAETKPAGPKKATD
jgi:hypothetical protein